MKGDGWTTGSWWRVDGWFVEAAGGLVWEVGEVLGQVHCIELLKGLKIDMAHARILQDWLLYKFLLCFFWDHA